MTEDDYKLPDGSIDFEKFRRDFKAADIPLKYLQKTAAKYVRKHGKSMDDILVELIQSGELTESEIAEAMEMLKGASKLVV